MHRSLRTLASACALALCLTILWSRPAEAADCGGTGLVITADTVAFGTYLSTSGSPTDANGRITVDCAVHQKSDFLPNLTITLSAGQAATFSPRKMANAALRLNYNLYTTAACTAVWGDGTGGTVKQSYSHGTNLFTTNFTVYGRIPASQGVGGGAYTDTITVTINY